MGATAQDPIHLLRHVRAIRSFRPDPLPDDVIADILEVARWTGSARNRQPWTFILIRNPATLRRIGELGAPQTTHVGRAPAAIAVVMSRGGTEVDAYDEGRVVERILTAAAAHGLGSAIGWIRDDVRPAAHELLGIPEPHRLRTVVSIGYPSAEGSRPKSAPGTARRPLDQLVRDERFS